jgi:hypothetical protein
MTAAAVDAAPRQWRRFAPAVAPPGELDARWWAGRTSVFRALGHDFYVRVHDETLLDYFEDVFAALRIEGVDAPAYSLIDRGPAHDSKRRYALYWGDERLTLCTTVSWAVSLLLWHINQQAVASAVEDQLVLHAAAATRDGVTVVLPAAMESGKTTTVAGLIRAGFTYITDEAVALDRSSLAITEFPKPLSVDSGSWKVLADLKPPHAGMVNGQWQVAPHRIHPDAVGGASPPRLVVAPKYTPGAATELIPIRAAEMACEVANSTFAFADNPQPNLEAIARLVERADCYRLTIGDLGAAVELIERLVDEVTASSTTAAPSGTRRGN